MSEYVVHYEAKMPPTRKFDVEQAEWRGEVFVSRAECLAARLMEPGNWSSDVALSGKKVTWTVTYPDGYDLSMREAVRETMAFVGYHGSDTLGPKSRKATLRFRLDGDDTVMSDPYVCQGAF